jgi:tetratricopeptide (TPR) repeat protein
MTKLKKMTKKKLKEPDEFINVAEKTFLFFSRHLKLVATGGIIAFVVLFVVYFFLRWENQKEGEGVWKFGLAVETYQRVSSTNREGSPPEYKNVLERFDEVILKFPRTSSGKLAFLYKGNIYLRLGEFDEAIKAYQTFLQKGTDEKLYRFSAMEGLGYAYEGKKDNGKALQAFQETLKVGEGFQLADAHLNMGRCFEKLGKKKEALENYKTFLKTSPKSLMTHVILEKASRLEH